MSTEASILSAAEALAKQKVATQQQTTNEQKNE